MARSATRRPSSPCADPADVEELATEARLLGVGAAPRCRAGHRFVLADAAHLGAQVMSLEVDRDTVRMEHRLERVRDAVRHALLDAEPARHDPDEPRQLADPDDLLMCHVSDPRLAEEGQSVMLAEREERDRAFDDLREFAVR